MSIPEEAVIEVISSSQKRKADPAEDPHHNGDNPEIYQTQFCEEEKISQGRYNRPQFNKHITELAVGTELCEFTSKEIADQIGNIGVVSLNNQQTWGQNSAQDLILRARWMDEQDQKFKERLNGKKTPYYDDYGFLSQLVKATGGGNCDDIAAWVFSTCVSDPQFRHCAVGVLQVGDTHSKVIVVGKDKVPYIVDAWLKPAKIIPLKNMEPHEFDQSLTLGFANVHNGHNNLERHQVPEYVKNKFAENESPGPREELVSKAARGRY